jgi:hypothetical protein
MVFWWFFENFEFSSWKKFWCPNGLLISDFFYEFTYHRLRRALRNSGNRRFFGLSYDSTCWLKGVYRCPARTMMLIVVRRAGLLPARSETASSCAAFYTLVLIVVHSNRQHTYIIWNFKFTSICTTHFIWRSTACRPHLSARVPAVKCAVGRWLTVASDSNHWAFVCFIKTCIAGCMGEIFGGLSDVRWLSKMRNAFSSNAIVLYTRRWIISIPTRPPMRFNHPAPRLLYLKWV